MHRKNQQENWSTKKLLSNGVRLDCSAFTLTRSTIANVEQILTQYFNDYIIIWNRCFTTPKYMQLSCLMPFSTQSNDKITPLNWVTFFVHICEICVAAKNIYKITNEYVGESSVCCASIILQTENGGLRKEMQSIRFV